MTLLTCFALIAIGYFLHKYLNKKETEVKYWNGPIPSKDEQNKNQNWISDHLVEYPQSMTDLGKNFPQATSRAKAVLRYAELEQLYKSGKITTAFYYTELDQIAGLIDISEDIK